MMGISSHIIGDRVYNLAPPDPPTTESLYIPSRVAERVKGAEGEDGEEEIGEFSRRPLFLYMYNIYIFFFF